VIKGNRRLPAIPFSCGKLFFMDREKKRWIGDLTFYSTVGLSMALAIFIGLAVGIYLDRYFNSGPWLTLLFLVLGIMAGYRNIGLAIKKIRKY
jgi:ATP synthase protein I